jgi:tetratricopeptide (TPR) repeat protein
VLLLVLVLGAAGGLLGRRLWAAQHLRRAQQALERLDFDQALEHLTLYLKVHPDDAEAMLLAGRTARRRGTPDEAGRYLYACERLQGVTQASALERALLDAQHGDLSGAEASLRSLVRGGGPDVPLILEALGQGYLRAFRLDDALPCLEELLRRRPDHHLALLWRGWVWKMRDQYEVAARDFQRAVDLRPQADQARLHLADALDRLGRIREAVAHYEYLRRRQPDNPEVVLGLARCRHDLHDLARADDLLAGFLARHPDSVPALVERGRLALHGGQPARGEEWARGAVARAPRNPDAYALLLLCLEAQGKAGEAGRCRDRLLRLQDEATRRAALTRQVLQRPRDPALRHQIGALWRQAGDEAQARRWFQSALQQDPSYAPAHEALEALEALGAKEIRR